MLYVQDVKSILRKFLKRNINLTRNNFEADFENSNNYFPQRRSSDQPFKPKNEGYNFRQYPSVYDRPSINQRRKGGNNNN